MIGFPSARPGPGDDRLALRPSDPAVAPAEYPLTSLHRGVILFLVLFLLVFPKGGIKIGGVPLTWGYLGLAPIFVVLSLYLARSAATLPASRLVVLAALLPFQAITFGGFIVNGISDVGYTISFLVTFFFLPWAFVLVLGCYIDRIDLRFLFRCIRFAVPFIAAYGIALFIGKMVTGTFFEIPYLTVNAGDAGGLEGKMIDRGGVFKLISTYNNGNLYGTSLLLLFPLYTWIEPRALPKWVVRASLLLTLSRAVWAGLIVSEILQRFYVRRVSLKTVVTTLLSLAVFGAVILYAVVSLLEMDPSRFLFDRTMGGRQANWERLDQTTFLPSTPFETILEIVYLSMLQNFGVAGLATFLIAMATPLLLFFGKAVPASGTEYKRSLATGLLTWLFMATGDGGLLYIPMGVNIWFVVSLLLSGNRSMLAETPADPPLAAETQPAADRLRLVPTGAG